MDLTCSICLEEITNFNTKKTLSCEHMFHKNNVSKLSGFVIHARTQKQLNSNRPE